MAAETYTNYANEPFFLSGHSLAKDSETVVQDAGRSGNIVKYTLMSYNPTTTKWEPFTDETATDGTQYPRGICMATLSEAEIKAGDVVNVPIVTGGEFTFNKDLLTIENSKTLATIINVPANMNVSVEDHLVSLGMHPEAVQSQDAYQS